MDQRRRLQLRLDGGRRFVRAKCERQLWWRQYQRPVVQEWNGQSRRQHDHHGAGDKRPRQQRHGGFLFADSRAARHEQLRRLDDADQSGHGRFHHAPVGTNHERFWLDTLYLHFAVERAGQQFDFAISVQRKRHRQPDFSRPNRTHDHHRHIQCHHSVHRTIRADSRRQLFDGRPVRLHRHQALLRRSARSQRLYLAALHGHDARHLPRVLQLSERGAGAGTDHGEQQHRLCRRRHERIFLHARHFRFEPHSESERHVRRA